MPSQAVSAGSPTVNDFERHEKIAPSYMTGVLRLTLVAPEIVEMIVEGRAGLPGLADAQEPFPVAGDGQHIDLG